jgi:hypothetical protein
MKNKLSPIFTLLMALAIALTGIAAAPAPAASAQGLDCPICNPDLSGYTGPLSKDEIHGLLLALNDEYHAYAVYGQVVSDFGANAPFANIQNSEQAHINALISQFNLYSVPVPANPWLGKIPSFASVTAACAAGVDAEIANRDLYTSLFQSTERAGIVNVYQSLQWASDQKHLPAFQSCASGMTQPGGGLGQGRGGNGRGNNPTWNNAVETVQPGVVQGNGNPGYGTNNVQPGIVPGNGNRGNDANIPQAAATPANGNPGSGANAPWWAGIYNWLFGQ